MAIICYKIENKAHYQFWIILMLLITTSVPDSEVDQTALTLGIKDAGQLMRGTNNFTTWF